MTATITILFFIFGAIIGSFLGVVVWRIGTGRGLGGRSQCLSCNNKLAWYELIPMVSYIAQRGKCRTCKSVIPRGDFWIELATAATFAGFGFAVVARHVTVVTPAAIVAALAIMVALACGIVIAAYDIKHHLIHLPSLGVLAIASLIASVAVHGLAYFASWHVISGIIIGTALVPLPFFLLWLVSRGKWIGFGDIEILAVSGLLFGVYGGYVATVLGFWIACAIVVPWFMIEHARGKKPSHHIPLGPFLLVGMYIAALVPIDIVAMVTRMVQ